MKGKIIILSAPSGTGKSTIISRLMEKPDLKLGFSVSATSRLPRGEEKDGKDYFFLTPEEFMQKVEEGKFVEWEEVYKGTCYGTLESEVERVTEAGSNLIMDVDVKGALSIKRRYGLNALSIFIMPPSVDVLESRLRNRATDSEETINKRLAKAEYEMSFSGEFDSVVVNDNLADAVNDVESKIRNFALREED
ncbi:MAG: guanylate kinase [Muribaculaceae bacterium]|nr:guanylate kinase [Muribaculaceae bacterium]